MMASEMQPKPPLATSSHYYFLRSGRVIANPDLCRSFAAESADGKIHCQVLSMLNLL